MKYNLPVLTIAIPSLNRSGVLLETLKQLDIPNSVQVLITNDGSTKGDYSEVEKYISKKSNYRIVHYSENFGCATALFRVFENCQTEYLITLSDEDIVKSDVLELLVAELQREDIGYAVIRMMGANRFKSTGISIKEVKSLSAYFSSNVFRVNGTRESLTFIRDLAKVEEFAHLYPHTLLAIIMVALGKKSVKISAQFHSNRVIEETEIRTLSGRVAHHPTERVIEYLSFLRCLDEIERFPGISKKLLLTAKKSAECRFFGSILDSISTLDLKARDDLIRSAPRTILAWYPKKMIKNLRNL